MEKPKTISSTPSGSDVERDMSEKPLRRLLRYVLPYKKRLALAAVFMIIFAGVTSYQAMLVYNLTASAPTLRSPEIQNVSMFDDARAFQAMLGKHR